MGILKYKVTNSISGEVRTWEGEAKKAHRTLRALVKQDLASFPESADKIVIEIEGEENEKLQYLMKAAGYLAKLTGGKIPSPEVKPKTEKKPAEKAPQSLPDFEIVNKKVIEARDAGELTALEAIVMDWILDVGFYAEYTFSDIEVTDIASGLKWDVNVIKGVVGSLCNKEYLWVEKVDTDRSMKIVYAKNKAYRLDDKVESKYPEAIPGNQYYNSIFE